MQGEVTIDMDGIGSEDTNKAHPLGSSLKDHIISRKEVTIAGVSCEELIVDLSNYYMLPNKGKKILLCLKPFDHLQVSLHGRQVRNPLFHVNYLADEELARQLCMEELKRHHGLDLEPVLVEVR